MMDSHKDHAPSSSSSSHRRPPDLGRLEKFRKLLEYGEQQPGGGAGGPPKLSNRRDRLNVLSQSLAEFKRRSASSAAGATAHHAQLPRVKQEPVLLDITGDDDDYINRAESGIVDTRGGSKRTNASGITSRSDLDEARAFAKFARALGGIGQSPVRTGQPDQLVLAQPRSYEPRPSTLLGPKLPSPDRRKDDHPSRGSARNVTSNRKVYTNHKYNSPGNPPHRDHYHQSSSRDKQSTSGRRSRSPGESTRHEHHHSSLQRRSSPGRDHSSTKNAVSRHEDRHRSIQDYPPHRTTSRKGPKPPSAHSRSPRPRSPREHHSSSRDAQVLFSNGHLTKRTDSLPRVDRSHSPRRVRDHHSRGDASEAKGSAFSHNTISRSPPKDQFSRRAPSGGLSQNFLVEQDRMEDEDPFTKFSRLAAPLSPKISFTMVDMQPRRRSTHRASTPTGLTSSVKPNYRIMVARDGNGGLDTRRSVFPDVNRIMMPTSQPRRRLGSHDGGMLDKSVELMYSDDDDGGSTALGSGGVFASIRRDGDGLKTKGYGAVEKSVDETTAPAFNPYKTKTVLDLLTERSEGLERGVRDVWSRLGKPGRSARAGSEGRHVDYGSSSSALPQERVLGLSRPKEYDDAMRDAGIEDTNRYLLVKVGDNEYMPVLKEKYRDRADEWADVSEVETLFPSSVEKRRYAAALPDMDAGAFGGSSVARLEHVSASNYFLHVEECVISPQSSLMDQLENPELKEIVKKNLESFRKEDFVNESSLRGPAISLEVVLQRLEEASVELRLYADSTSSVSITEYQLAVRLLAANFRHLLTNAIAIGRTISSRYSDLLYRAGIPWAAHVEKIHRQFKHRCTDRERENFRRAKVAYDRAVNSKRRDGLAKDIADLDTQIASLKREPSSLDRDNELLSLNGELADKMEEMSELSAQEQRELFRAVASVKKQFSGWQNPPRVFYNPAEMPPDFFGVASKAASRSIDATKPAAAAPKRRDLTNAPLKRNAALAAVAASTTSYREINRSSWSHLDPKNEGKVLGKDKFTLSAAGHGTPKSGGGGGGANTFWSMGAGGKGSTVTIAPRSKDAKSTTGKQQAKSTADDDNEWAISEDNVKANNTKSSTGDSKKPTQQPQSDEPKASTGRKRSPSAWSLSSDEEVETVKRPKLANEPTAEEVIDIDTDDVIAVDEDIDEEAMVLLDAEDEVDDEQEEDPERGNLLTDPMSLDPVPDATGANTADDEPDKDDTDDTFAEAIEWGKERDIPVTGDESAESRLTILP